MTREAQKTAERQTLAMLLAALGLPPDQQPEAGEAPDFVVSLSGHRIGIEITMYSSTDTVDGRYERRQVEGEWDKLRSAARAFCATRPDLRDINIILFFCGALPPQPQHIAFIEEIAAFVAIHRHELRLEEHAPRSKEIEYWPQNFSTPLMAAYLQMLCIRVDRFADWTSNITAGFVATPATSTIAEIVADKSAKQFQPVDEVWLAIQCSTRISEMLLPIETISTRCHRWTASDLRGFLF
jgi:hypothetical protein